LHREDAAAAAVVGEALSRDGVTFILDSEIGRIDRTAEGKKVLLRVGGRQREVTVDEILVGAGRVPNTDHLGLDAAGVAFTAEGVRVDDRLRTTTPHIFAAGGVCSRFKFTHAADALARIVLQNALFPGRRRASALTIPWCTYTEPELA